MEVKIYFKRLEKQLVLQNWYSGLTDVVYMDFSYSVVRTILCCLSLLCSSRELKVFPVTFTVLCDDHSKPTAVTYSYSPQGAPKLYEHWNKGIDADNVPRPQQEALGNRKHW